jgi:hypothetical protein
MTCKAIEADSGIFTLGSTFTFTPQLSLEENAELCTPRL